MPPVILVEFVGGPRCGHRDKIRIAPDCEPPEVIDDVYRVCDQELGSGALAYAYDYPKPRRRKPANVAS